MFDNFDKNQNSANIYSEIVNGVCLVIFGAHEFLLYFPDSTGETLALSSSSAMKIPCIEHLEKPEAPSFPDAYPVYLAFQIIVQIIDAQADFLLPLLQSTEPTPEKEILLAIEMAKSAGPGLFYSLFLLSVSSIEEDFFLRVLKSIERYAQIVGLLGLVSYRDAILINLCKVCITSIFSTTNDYSCIPPDIEPFNINGLHNRTAVYVLSDRNIHLLNCLVQVSDVLVDVMDSKMWFAILETLSFADHLANSSKIFKKMESNASMLLDTNQTGKQDSVRLRSSTTPGHLSFLELYACRVTHPLNEIHTSLFAAASKHIFERTSSMKLRAFTEFVRALCRLAQETTSTVNSAMLANLGKETIKSSDEKSYAVSKLHEISISNLSRLLSADFQMFDMVSTQFINIAHSPGCSSIVRSQVCNSLGDIIVSASLHELFSNQEIETHVLGSVKILMAFESRTETPMEPESYILRSFLPEVRRLGIEIIYKLLQTSGQNIKSSWLLIFEVIFQAIHSHSANIAKRARLTDMPKNFQESAILLPSSPITSPSNVSESPTQMDPAPVISSKSNLLIRVGFPCIQLVVSDFLNLLNPIPLSKCIETLTSFGSLSDDLNISLTSIGLLWTLCDYILTQRQELERTKPADEPRDSAVVTSPLEELALDLSILEEPICVKTMDTLWMYLLRNLSELCSDERPEVRNSANQTLFRTISMNGSRLTLQSWDLCISHVLFPLLDRIRSSSSANTGKSWDETKSLTLSGVTKSLIDFLPVLMGLGERFDRHWVVFLNYMKNTCLESSQDVALVSLKNFKLLVQYAKGTTDHPISEELQSKLLPLWNVAFEVWVAIGQGILDSADENNAEGDVASGLPLVTWSDGATPYLLQGPFSQEVISMYSSIIFELHPVIKSTFANEEFDVVTSLLKNLLLYHSKPITGATQSRLRVDAVMDLDQLTNSQSSYMDIMAGKLDFSGLVDVKFSILSILSDLISFPFIPFKPLDTQNSGESENEKGLLFIMCGIKKHTYIALARKAYLLMSTMFDELREETKTYSSGAFENALRAMIIPVRYKHEGPSVGTKDPTPLWKTAAILSQKIISESLFVLAEIYEDDKDIDQQKLHSLYTSILDYLQEFLLSNR